MIKLAGKKDIEELIRLRIMQQEEEFGFLDEEVYREELLVFFNNHLNKDFFVMVYSLKDEIVATCCLQIIERLPKYDNSCKLGYICNVFTCKEYRRKNIQSLLLNECFNLGMDYNVVKFTLRTKSEIAINLYKKIGFVFDENYMFYIRK